MAKLLKLLVIVILALSIVSLALGIMLFSRRDMLKGRTQRLEQGVVELAQSLRVEQFDGEKIKVLDQMQAPLKELAVIAGNKYEEADNYKQDIEKTRGDLARTVNERDAAREETAAAQASLDNLRAEMETKEVELAQARGRAQQVEQDKARLQMEVDDLNTKLVQAEEETRDLQDKVATLQNTIDDMMQKYGEMPVDSTLRGLSGHVLLVNSYWNFVVIDLGSRAGLSANTEMLVHRGDQLVGRVRITTVKESMSVAEILSDWEQSPIREGDYVLF
ncbi:MAG: hypothetical protein JXB04_00345 [Kiritimatiellae bacterium]|nr:hypothetical protein [Kiritimatiellia bacterium]